MCGLYFADNPLGPFKRKGTILQANLYNDKGARHHSVIKISGKDTWYIVYHLMPLNEKDGNSRVTCIEHMYFYIDGYIKPVIITNFGVEKNKHR